MKRVLLCLGRCCLPLSARAQLTIEITTSGGRQIPIAVLPMAGESAQPAAVSDVVGADLARTGLFRLVSTAGVSPLPTEPSEVNFADWTRAQRRGAGDRQVDPAADGRFEVRFRLLDVQKQAQLAASPTW